MRLFELSVWEDQLLVSRNVYSIEWDAIQAGLRAVRAVARDPEVELDTYRVAIREFHVRPRAGRWWAAVVETETGRHVRECATLRDLSDVRRAAHEAGHRVREWPL